MDKYQITGAVREAIFLIIAAAVRQEQLIQLAKLLRFLQKWRIQIIAIHDLDFLAIF